MDYGMKVVMTKPGPEPGTEFVDEMSLALPSIVQVGDTEFVHAKLDAAALIKRRLAMRALDVCHAQRRRPLHALHRGQLPGTGGEFLRETQSSCAPKKRPMQEVKPYDKRKFMPYKGNVRKEDLMTQAPRGCSASASEQLGVSDRGVIKFRQIVLDAIETRMERRPSQGWSRLGARR